MPGTRFIAAGTVLATLAVAAGAFGAHAMKHHVAADDLAIFNTGVQYQMAHALALILFGLFVGQRNSPAVWPGISFFIGIVVFSGSLYALVLTGIRKFGIITPIGGVAFLIGWIGFTMAAIHETSDVSAGG